MHRRRMCMNLCINYVYEFHIIAEEKKPDSKDSIYTEFKNKQN